mgnify:CR=1 FL=1
MKVPYIRMDSRTLRNDEGFDCSLKKIFIIKIKDNVMSLDTILAIGRAVRKMDKALEHHRYVRKAPLLRMAGKKEIHYRHFMVSVNKHFEVDVASLKENKNDDFIKQNLYYLAYRTSEADTYVKYIFGDICSDYFKFADDSKKGDYAKNSFDRGIGNAESIKSPVIDAFRKSLGRHIETILERIQASIEGEEWFLYFDFGGKCWYELTETFEQINEAILGNFIKKDKEGNISLSAFLVRTLIESAGALPNFDLSNSYKTKRFEDMEEVKNLLYGLGFGLKHKIREDDIKINLLPKGDNLTGEDIVKFYEPRKDSDEKKFKIEKDDLGEVDDFFAPALNDNSKIVSYDIVFSKESKPIGIDLLELKDVEKNQLMRVQKKIYRVKNEMQQEGFFMDNLNIRFSLKSIFDKKKYKKHLLKVLPLIYKDAYREDLVLLPALLQQSEYGVRNDDKYKTYPYLKRYFYFLIKLQKYDNMKKITETQSYELGLQLGIMAEPFAAWRKDDCPVKSFEKNYVGMLSRRINKLEDISKFVSDINGYVMMHNKEGSPVGKAYYKIMDAHHNITKILSEFEERYNKDYCSLGFFENYYSYRKKDTAKSEEATESTPNS